MPRRIPEVERDDVRRFWFERQGLSQPRGSKRFTRKAFVDYLERTGGLQIDTVNVLDRAHYLTLWSRFGSYDRATVDRWVYRDRVAYEYWGHEASILPLSHLSFSRRRMKRFPGKWATTAWWPRFETSNASKRRALRRLGNEGPLESADFERTPEASSGGEYWGNATIPKEDKRSLKLLWHGGRVAVHHRRHFRCVYDLAENVYPNGGVSGPAARQTDVEDHWLRTVLSGNGVTSERHMVKYFTSPSLSAPDRRRILDRNRRKGAIVEVKVDSVRGRCWALPEHLDQLGKSPQPTGTTLICPFDSLLWERERAKELLDFDYRIEIYTPPKKRKFGYYAMPILHDGRLVGRVAPKLHREDGLLEIKRVDLEPGFRRDRAFDRALDRAFEDLMGFTGASDCRVP